MVCISLLHFPDARAIRKAVFQVKMSIEADFNGSNGACQGRIQDFFPGGVGRHNVPEKYLGSFEYEVLQERF